MYRKKYLKSANYDDSLVKNKGITFGKDVLKLNLIINPKQRKIDLLCEDDSELGVELENGHWKGDFWENEAYCMISGLEFATVNIPIRKEKYWKEFNKWFGKMKYNPGWKKNIFVRTNIDFTQIIVIRPEVITNPEKCHKTRFKANNCDEIEDWLSFKREDVETYNLIDGKFILDK